jgi:peptidoglycan hydrolase-like protein with peptidoglycan-binding domain
MFKKTLLASAMLAALASPVLANYQQGYIAYQEGRYTSAYIEFKSSADAGNASAQYMLGRLYHEGRGVDRDLVQAIAWYDLAAGNGSAEAANARAQLAPQLSSYQLQTAASLTAQWRGNTAAQPAPAPTPAAYVAYSVRNVQLALNQLGYSAGTADGVMGPKTRAAIRAYQIDSGLPASGEPSVALHERLQASLASGGSDSPSTPTGPSATLISEVQGELRLRGYAIPAVNGVLDAATVAAIKRYQADASLTADGQVSDALLAQLRSGRSDPAADYRAQVKAVQAALNARGYDAGPADGALGPRTRAAIRAFQAEVGLSSTGAVDAALLASLDIATTPGTPTTGGSGATVIAAIEGELVRRNYAAGTIDGVLDAQARSAIALFQRDADLEITGQASQTLLDKLRVSTLRNETDTLSQVVWQIEGQLRSKGYRVGTIDGTLDAETVAGIEAFQKDAGLKVNGNPSAKLLAALEGAVVVGDGGGEGNSNLLTARQTWEVEARLKARGYDVGVLDTKADAKTYAAVRAFQKDEGLPVTGRIDESLLARLQLADSGEQQGTRELTDTEKGMLIVKGLLDSFAPKVQ